MKENVKMWGNSMKIATCKDRETVQLLDLLHVPEQPGAYSGLDSCFVHLPVVGYLRFIENTRLQPCDETQ